MVVLGSTWTVEGEVEDGKVAHSVREINWSSSYADTPYSCFELDEPITIFDPDTDYGVLLVTGGLFASVSKAWKAGYKGQIPSGWTEFRANKVKVFIWNPSYSSSVIDPEDPSQYGPFIYVAPLTEIHMATWKMFDRD